MLCVGGPLAGRVVEIDSRMDQLEVPAYLAESTFISDPSNEKLEAENVQVFTYIRTSLHDQNKKYNLMFHDEGKSIIQILIDGYNPVKHPPK